MVIKIQAGYRVARTRMLRFLFNRQRPARAIELDHAVTLRIVHMVGKDMGAAFLSIDIPQLVHQRLSVKNIVAEDKRTGPPADELAADDKRLCQAVWVRLFCVPYVDFPLIAFFQQLLEAGSVFVSRDLWV